MKTSGQHSVKERIAQGGLAVAFVAAAVAAPVVAGSGDSGTASAPPARPPSPTATPFETPKATPTPAPTATKPAPSTASKPAPAKVQTKRQAPKPAVDPLAATRSKQALRDLRVVERKMVHPGIEFVRFTAKTQKGQPIVGHYVIADVKRKDLTIRTTKPSERGMRPSAFAKKYNAIVTVNAGAWETKGPFAGQFHPRGLMVGQGQLWKNTADTNKDTFFACTQGDACFTDRQNTTVQRSPEWFHVINGWGSILVDGGKPNFNYEGQEPASHKDARHPRTALATTKSGKVVAMVIEGRHSKSVGVNYAENANLFVSPLFAKDKINQAVEVDGGGSSKMMVFNQPITKNETPERVVSNVIAFVKAG